MILYLQGDSETEFFFKNWCRQDVELLYHWFDASYIREFFYFYCFPVVQINFSQLADDNSLTT